MFNKKKSAEKPSSAPFPVQILTTEYLIEGTAQGDQQYYLPVGTEYWSPIGLADVKISVVSGDNIPVRAVDRFEVKGNALVAMIVRRDPNGMLQFDSYLRYVDDLPFPATPAYLELDARLGWSPCQNLELAIVGRNLLDDAHPEFASSPLNREVQRSVYGILRWSF